MRRLRDGCRRAGGGSARGVGRLAAARVAAALARRAPRTARGSACAPPRVRRRRAGARARRRRRLRRAARPGARRAAHRRRLGERELDGSSARASLARAEALVAHRFDLLGSGPTELGPRDRLARATSRPAARWPLDHICRVPIVYGDGSDIKVPWELSRCQHLPLLAAAHRLTGDAALPRRARRPAERLDRRQPGRARPQLGVHDGRRDPRGQLGRRAGALLPSERPRPWLDERRSRACCCTGASSARTSSGARCAATTTSPTSSGCCPSPRCSPAAREGRGWAAVGGRRARARDGPPGARRTAATTRRRSPTTGSSASSSSAAPRPPRRSARARSRPRSTSGSTLMLAFVADHTRPDGLAPQVGDADDGRFLPLGDYGAPTSATTATSSAQAGRRPSAPARPSAAYPDGGYYVMRARRACTRSSAAATSGSDGVGGHAHNDQLSFELALGRPAARRRPRHLPLHADPAARNAFPLDRGPRHARRSTGASRTRCARTTCSRSRTARTRAPLRWEADGARASFAGEHRGLRAGVHRRRVSFDGDAPGRWRSTTRSPAASGCSGASRSPPARRSTRRGRARPRALAAPRRSRVEAPDGVAWAVERGLGLARATASASRAPVLRARSGARGHARFVLRAATA